MEHQLCRESEERGLYARRASRLLGMIDNAARAKGVIPKQFYDTSGGIPRAVADMT